MAKMADDEEEWQKQSTQVKRHCLRGFTKNMPSTAHCFKQGIGMSWLQMDG